jgi:NAD(P)-dependent dehydrogenase (short-subunit alcohol dehydrogenase family)
MGSLDGKVALITGGARGQGRAHAIALARKAPTSSRATTDSPIESVPYALAVAADLTDTARQVDALGRRCLAVPADVRRLPEMQAPAE